MKRRGERYEDHLELHAAMQQTGLSRDPNYALMWEASLGDSFRAHKLKGKLSGIVESAVIAHHILASRAPAAPHVHDGKAISLAPSLKSGHLVTLDSAIINRHVLFFGTNGSGKTNGIAHVLLQLIARGITAEFIDHKCEGRRFPGAIVFRPDQEAWNILEPIGTSESYWMGWSGELGKAFNLRPETWTELVEILKRLELGLQPGEPYPSLKDLERILLKVAAQEGRSKLVTAARALSSLNALLGKTAYIRRAPELSGRSQLHVYECQGLPHRIQNFLSALRLLRRQLKTSGEGHDTALRHVQVIDEAGEVFGKELAQYEGSGYVAPHKRAITQIRSSGVGILAGAQIPSDIDDALKSNVSTILCFKCPNPKDAREACDLLGLPSECARDIQTLSVGVAYVRSEGFTRPEKVQLPFVNLGEYPSNAAVAERMADQFRWIAEHTIYAPEVAADTKPISYRTFLGEEPPATPEVVSHLSMDGLRQKVLQIHFAFLQDIAAHAEGGVFERYERLGLSAGKGTRIKKVLVNLGLIICTRAKSANGRPCDLLALSETGKELLRAHTA